MSDTWATSGADLHLDLTGRRVRAGLETALRDAVRTGRLGPSTQLPSSRALARDLGIARNTVAEAYSQLVAEGWLTAWRGSGTQVADRAAAGHGLALEGLSRYSTAQRHRHGPSLVVGYGTPPEHAFTGAVVRLCAVLKESAGP